MELLADITTQLASMHVMIHAINAREPRDGHTVMTLTVRGEQPRASAGGHHPPGTDPGCDQDRAQRRVNRRRTSRMKAVFQRVDSARVTAEGKTTGEIGPGALILLGVEADDTPAHAALMAKKAAELRVFCDEHGKMNRSLLDTGGEVLAVSNFTLCANCRHGRRPEFLGRPGPKPPGLCTSSLCRSCGAWAWPGWRPACSAPICRYP